MANNYDDLGFQPTNNRQPSNNHSDLGFQPNQTQQSNAPGYLESALRGAAQGATFGFQDELAGAGESLLDKLRGINQEKSLLDLYRQHRDEARAANQAAEETNPLTYGAGNLGGALAPALLTMGTSAPASAAAAAPEAINEGTALARMIAASKVGAAGGAAAGLGTSTSDLTQGDVSGTAKDVLEGAGSGAILGGALQGGIETAKGIGKLGNKLINAGTESRTGQNLINSYNYGKQGIDLVTPKGLETAENNVTNAAANVGLGTKQAAQQAGAAVGAAKQIGRETGITVNVSDEINKIQGVIDQLRESDNPDAIKDVNKLQDYINNLLLGKDRTGGIDPANVDFKKAEDIKNTLNNFNGIAGGTPKLETNEAINNAKLAAKSINDKLTQSVPELAKANENNAAVNQAFEVLGIDPKNAFIKDAVTGQQRLTTTAQLNLKNRIRQYAMETATGGNSEFRLNDALRLLEKADPEAAKALKPEIEKTSEIYNLANKAQQLGLLNKSTYLKSGIVQAGNRTGMIAKSISDATPDQLKTVAQSVINQGAVGMKLASELAGVMKKDNIGRNAALFSLNQNPEYRKMLGQYFGDNNQQ